MVTKIYLPFNLCDRSDNIDSSGKSDSSDQTTFFHQNIFFYKKKTCFLSKKTSSTFLQENLISHTKKFQKKM